MATPHSLHHEGPQKPPPSTTLPLRQHPQQQPQPTQQTVQALPVQPATGLRYPSSKKTIYDRNINRSKTAELSRAAFAYLFIEMIGYAQRRVKGVADLEKRLNEAGQPLGHRLLPLLLHRLPSPPPRPTRILPLLQFITTTLWRHLFGRPADTLERSAANAAEYMISDNEPLVSQYISVPREMGNFNAGAFVAGVIEGVCVGAGFEVEGVTAHGVAEQGGGEGGMWPGKTVFLIRFCAGVLEREEGLGKGM
ncbi:TRAPP I complex [Patellaria atrata CBS 101060]|uniref:Trafficking protein particle complex subunit n=1 Tax=Patellaria atrata CBS 101060 TaxID=1346257 RepID=A0A9P4S8U3_9PEZI|nr:TRAPP I complex [Patellaria atrata CBS 101060]